MATILGQQTRPRTLVFGFGQDHGPSIASLFSTSKQIDSWHPERLEQIEWDLLVTSAGIPANLAPHIHVLAFGGADLGQPDNRVGMRWTQSVLSMGHRVHGTEIVIPDDIPVALDNFIRTVLVPHLERMNAKPALAERTGDHYSATPPSVEPFAMNATGFALAGRFVRKGGLAECWVFPSLAEPANAVTAILPALAVVDPKRFPSIAGWAQSEAWETGDERGARLRLESAEQELQRVVAEMEVLVSDARTEFEQARLAADVGDHLMLTGQGEPLVEAVADALQRLGFKARNMDAEIPSGDRREDLRITFAGSPGWEAIVEVRGYKRGAQLSDLGRLERFAKRYLQETGQLPTRMWYIVNQFLEQDPAGRPQPLVSNPHEVKDFAKEGGLVIDTMALFRILHGETGSSTINEIARELTDRTGLYPR